MSKEQQFDKQCASERLAREIRDALGALNDDNEPVVTLVAKLASAPSHVGQINEHPAGNRTNAGTGERSPDQPREVGRTPTHEPATANREDTERDRAEGSGGRELGHAVDRGGLDAAPCAPSTTPQKPDAGEALNLANRIVMEMAHFEIDPDEGSPDHNLLTLARAVVSTESATPRSEPFGWYGMMSNGDGTESPRFESGAKPWCLKDMRDAKPLYLRLPLNLGEPINHARLEAILWRWGSGTVTLDCDDQGRFRLHVEHAEAADEVYVHAEQEGVLDAAIAATANNRADGTAEAKS